jgi:hypothetical protein
MGTEHAAQTGLSCCFTFGLSIAVAVPRGVLAQQGQNAPADSDPEKAIAAYEAALSVTTRAQLPDEWALTQNNLGRAYLNRIRGDRADNLEKSIAAYEASPDPSLPTRQAPMFGPLCGT